MATALVMWSWSLSAISKVSQLTLQGFEPCAYNVASLSETLEIILPHEKLQLKTHGFPIFHCFCQNILSRPASELCNGLQQKAHPSNFVALVSRVQEVGKSLALLT